MNCEIVIRIFYYDKNIRLFVNNWRMSMHMIKNMVIKVKIIKYDNKRFEHLMVGFINKYFDFIIKQIIKEIYIQKW